MRSFFKYKFKIQKITEKKNTLITKKSDYKENFSVYIRIYI